MNKKEYKEPILKVVELENVDSILLQESSELGYSIDYDEEEDEEDFKIETVKYRVWDR